MMRIRNSDCLKIGSGSGDSRTEELEAHYKVKTVRFGI